MIANLTYAKERDCDLLLMRLFETSKDVTKLFLKVANFEDMEITEICQNQKTKDGESDLIIKGKFNNETVEILIEDKIDAPAMKEQSERYQVRGNEDVKNGKCSSFSVILFCPKKYYQSNNMAKKYPAHIFFEDVLNILKNNNGLKTDIALLEAAITKSKGRQLVENKAITLFWNEYYAFLKSNYGNRGLRYIDHSNEPKGNMSGWPMFQTGLKGTDIILKGNYGWVDLQFFGMGNRIADIESICKDILLPNESVEKASGSAAIRIPTDIIDFEQTFTSQKDKVILNVDAVLRAYDIIKFLKNKQYIKFPLD